ncbi:MAG: pilus assembly protein TadG-related protein [Armatimonadetes bacterium]|nr:pilus assembly protein TadG-related protein [Armatimonadota bacterium]MDW8123034.1 pilus assembly protein TadG-related protein [Armatimonadota bacterium]
MKKNRRRGTVGVLVALGIVAFLMMAALVVDLGSAILARQDLQINADAAALAGAQDLGSGASAAKSRAAEYYSRNMTGNPTPAPVDCPPGSDPNTTCYQIGTDLVEVTSPAPPPGGGTSDPSRIKVRASRRVTYYFARVMGFFSKRVSAQATARRGGGGGAGVMILHTSNRGALTVGTGTGISVGSGGMVVNSNNPAAIVVENYAGLTSTQPLQVVGTWEVGFQSTLSPTPVRIPTPLSDPLANLQPPSGAANCGSVTGLIVVTVDNSPYYLNPGTHPAVGVEWGGVLHLREGVHVFCRGLTVQGGLIGERVFIYVHSGFFQIEPPWGLDWNAVPPSFGNIRLGPMSSGPYAGITLFNARTNGPYTVFLRTGLGRHYQGIFYNPAGTIQLGVAPHCTPCDFSQAFLITGNLVARKEYAGAPRTIALSGASLPPPYGSSSGVVLEE